MKIHIPDFESARVLVVGDAMLDRYWHGSTSRISPEAPVPVVRVDQAEERPGGAGNVALNIAALGARVSLVAVTGADDTAQALAGQLSAAGVRCLFRSVAGMATVTKLRVLSRHQQLIRLDFEGGIPGFDGSALLEPFHEALPEADVVVLSDYGKGTLGAIRDLIKAARAAGLPVLVDPKSRDFGLYRGASLVTPNLAEFEAVAGHCHDEAEIAAKGTALLAEHDIEALLITRGEQGMTLLRRGNAALHLPAKAREVYDVTGAGDTVISVLAATLAAGEDLAQATALANLAAGIVVGKLGTATVSVPEIRRTLRENGAVERGVVTVEQLLAAVEQARGRGERLVMTNGCFDILHAGHVAYLQEARRLGDRLIIAVNDDDSVRRLKGATRPINSLDHRTAVLAALQCVDWVVPFGEDTPRDLICRVRPDYLVKGGDYRPEQVAGYDCVTAGGGEVMILAYHAGQSTSRIIERCRT
ncbi:MAG: bifunctional D-glycero-beta-D-manno-heptose-7-phosphate kinase/D-glycero-beta-D-manno-heptose 1-phosphate adenylyltransferase HldE [Gammaproteobacteria bacterium]